MSGKAVSQLLSTTLYYRRFFPYYAFCMVTSIDEEGPIIMESHIILSSSSFLMDNKLHIGKVAVYGYDAVGSFKRDEYGCMGSGQNFVMPILDNLVTHMSIKNIYIYLKSLR